METQMQIFVTGGSGFVGQHLVRRLVRAGHEVRALARTDSAADL
ncbi:dihydroflavonol 4-reductase, partial [Mycobacterium sp. PO1]